MIEKRKVYFRADAGPNIGYGHYIRSLALADMLKQDFDCTMFTQMPTDYQLRECEAVCPIVALPDDDSKFEKFLEYLRGDEIVVLDNYFFTTDYQRAIKAKGCKLVCIDDMHDKHYVADVVINHGCTGASLFDIEPYTKLCLGMDYALLRRPFWKPAKCERIPKTYAICFGGSDAYNITYKYANELSKKNGKIIAVVGDSYQYEDTLKTLPNVEIRKRLSADEMASLFSSVENVICSVSTTCYEALRCGARVYAGWYVDNQKEVYEMWAKNGYILPLGNLCDDACSLEEYTDTSKIEFSDNVSNIRCVFNELGDNKMNELFIDRQKVYQLDGYEFINFCSLPKEELLKICDWRNHPSIRINMYNQDIIPYDNHLAFVQSLKSRDDAYYWLVKRKDKDVGVLDLVDIDIANRRAILGFYLQPNMISSGMGFMILGTTYRFATETLGFEEVYGEVKKSNVNALIIDYYWGERLNEEDLNNLDKVEYIRFSLHREEFLKSYHQKNDFRKFLEFVALHKDLINRLKAYDERI